MTEAMWIERATELAEAANRCLRASTECLREAEQARLTAERESPLAGDWKSSAPAAALRAVGTTGEAVLASADSAAPRGRTALAVSASPAEDSDDSDPGAAPAVLGSPNLQVVSG